MKYVEENKSAVRVWWATVRRTLEINQGLDLCNEEHREKLTKDLALSLSREGLGVHNIEEGLIYRGRPKESENGAVRRTSD